MNKRMIGSMWETILLYKGSLLLAAGSILIANVLLVLNPLFLRQALIAVASPEQRTEHNFLTPFVQGLFGSSLHSPYPWALLLLVVATISGFFKYLMRLIFIRIGREVETSVREKVFQRIHMQSRLFFDRHGIGDLLSRLTNDIAAYRDLIGPALMYPFFAATLVIPALMALYSISPWLSLISMIPIMIIVLFNLLVRTPFYHASQALQDSLGQMSVLAHEHYSGIRLIKSYGVLQAMSTLFQKGCLAFNRSQYRFSFLQGMIFPSLSLVTRLTTIVLVLFAGAAILLQWQGMSMADLLSLMWLQSYIFSPLMMLAWMLPLYQRGKAGYERLVEIYEEPIEVSDIVDSIEAIPPKADIEFIGLSYTYPSQQVPVLKEVSLRIRGGSFVGITGPVGSGKSTLLRLLNRDYEIPPGKILIRGRDIHDYSVHTLHKAVVLVEQLPFLFSKTVGENIRFGKQHAGQEEVEDIARQVDLHETILAFPDHYHTLVGERGVSLSGGQKQRIAIARAFLVDHSILLLDDVFSALDAETEKRIFASMKKNLVGKTVVFITHRASILEEMDHVFCMCRGEIVEEGKPNELLKQRGFYHALVTIQKAPSNEQ